MLRANILHHLVFKSLAAALCLTGLCLHMTAAGAQAADKRNPGQDASKTGSTSTERWDFEFRDVTLDQALFRISERTGAEFIYEPRLTAGKTASGEFRDSELRAVLDAILLPAGLEARRIRTGIFVIRLTLRREINPVMSVVPEAQSSTPTIRVPQRVPARATDLEIPVSEIIRKIVVP